MGRTPGSAVQPSYLKVGDRLASYSQDENMSALLAESKKNIYIYIYFFFFNTEYFLEYKWKLSAITSYHI